ncbi:MAG: phosphate ABC transporter substrate-binding protein [Cyanobacteria bacterium P01_D01_bin.73]
MTQKNNSGPLSTLAFLISIGLLGMGLWWLVNRLELFGTSSGTPNNPAAVSTPAPGTVPGTVPGVPGAAPAPNAPNSGGLSSLPSAPVPNAAPAAVPANFSQPQSIPAGTTIRIGGSTSMVQISQALKGGIEGRYPGVVIAADAQGTGAGIAAIAQGSLDVAGISRALNPQESQAGLASVPIARDAIALVVGRDNPFSGSLSPEQVAAIFQGKITNWVEVGGPTRPIRVINRPSVSGTHQAFKTVVLGGKPFGTTGNITTMERDATTPMLRALGNDGIGYATSAQVATQQTVRIVPINGINVFAADYPLQRVLSYAYRQPPNPSVQAFLGFALSQDGQRAIQGQ